MCLCAEGVLATDIAEMLGVSRAAAKCYNSAAPEWHTCSMARIRLSTTVDASLLEAARGVHPGPTDAALVDDALRALLARNRAHEIDASYAAYDEKPTDQPDEWGDLDSWRRAASAS